MAISNLEGLGGSGVFVRKRVEHFYFNDSGNVSSFSDTDNRSHVDMPLVQSGYGSRLSSNPGI